MNTELVASGVTALSGDRAPSQTAGQRVRVLVADDAEGIRFLLCTLLEVEDDFEVVGQASNGAEAVELARRHRPQLVLLDLAMPVKDGLQVLRELRQDQPDTCIVVFSAYDAVPTGSEAIRRGADDYVEKGTGVDELVDRVRAACRRRAERRTA